MGVIAQIVRAHGQAYLEAAGERAPLAQHLAVHRLTACRSGELGGHAEYCPDCGGLVEFVPHSCRDRLCSVCRGPEAHAWLEARQRELLPGRYFHAVFTLPVAYSEAVRSDPQRLGGALMEAVAEALQRLAGDPQRLGGELGITEVLHSWGRSLSWHAHVHCLIPGVVLHPDGTCSEVRTRFLLPVQALKKVFRAIVTRRFRAARPGFDPPGSAWRKPWNLVIRPCDEGPGTVLGYLTRYVRSGPLNEAQIVQADEQCVAFRYLDHRSGKVRVLRSTPMQFLGRYLQHALPYRFHRIRHYGFLAPSRRDDLHRMQVALLARYTASCLAPETVPCGPAPIQPCPHCGSLRPRIRVHLRPRDVGVLLLVSWREHPALAP